MSKRLCLKIILLMSCLSVHAEINKEFESRVKEYEASAEFITLAVSGFGTARQTYIACRPFADYLGIKLSKKVRLVQRRTFAEINQLFVDGEVDVAYIAAGAYLDLIKKTSLYAIASAKRSDAKYANSVVIVPYQSPVQSMVDLKGKSFAYVDKLSIPGFYYPNMLISKLANQKQPFFARTIFAGSEMASVRAVRNNYVDAAAVSASGMGIALNHIKNNPKKLRVIKSEKIVPGSPLVVSNKVNKATREQLQHLVLSMHKEPKGKLVLSGMKITGFVEFNQTDYEQVTDRLGLTVNKQ